tara:strand:+ start:121 stop:363 length:243 start_codon:yes stop_codon:yes gene_type:complete
LGDTFLKDSPPRETSKTKGYIAPVPKQRSISLVQEVEKMKQYTKFDNSKDDKSNILEYKNIPKLRNKLESLKHKDRFQTK